MILALATIVLLAACGSSSTPQGTLEPFLTDWSRGLAGDADVGGRSAGGLRRRQRSGVRRAWGELGSLYRGPGRQSGARASALVTERFALPHVGTWSPTTIVRLVQRNGRWLVSWTPGTINPALRVGDRLDASELWPARAPILGAGGVPLTIQRQAVVVGIVGSRIKSTRAVTGDLLGAGATQAQVRLALAQAKAYPDYFDAIFQVSKDRFEQLKAQPGPDNVYAVPGTEFQLTEARSAITPQLTAHVVGTVGPITAQQLQQLGPPYGAASVVGQSGLEQQYERQLAGRRGPRSRSSTRPALPWRRWPTSLATLGRRSKPASIPRSQRAAEAALASEHRNVALVAINASTGRILALVSDPVPPLMTTRCRASTRRARRSKS